MKVLGYFFINDSGMPIGNVVPTLEEAQHIARFEYGGWFYQLVQPELSAPYAVRVGWKTRTNEQEA